MNKEKEKLRLYKIIKSSERVRSVREMMGLGKDEYLISSTYESNSTTWEIGNKNNSKVRLVKDEFKGDELSNLLIKVQKYIEKEIIDYFNLGLEYYFVSGCIYGRFMPNNAFEFIPFIKKETGKPEIHIIINEVLTSDTLQYLFQKIEDYNFFIKDFFRIKNTKGLNCLDSSYERGKPIDFFDEKYELANQYDLLKIKYSRIPEAELQNLVEKAQKLLGKKSSTGYNAKSLRKDVDQFRSYFDL